MRVYRWLLFLGILLRLLFVLIPGNLVWPPWSAGGDVRAYATLGENLVHGQGYTYSGQPTALRPPLYPLLVAGCMAVAGRLWPVVLRLFQFLLGLATAFIGAKTADRLWGAPTGRAAALLILYSPTLVYPTSMVAPEALAAFLVALVFYFAVGDLRREPHPVLAGASLGVATLAKEVTPVLGALFLVLYLRGRSLRGLAIFALTCTLVMFPWAVRNYIVLRTFRLSTLGAYALVDGLTNPQGRSQAGGDERTLRALGWNIQVYERNGRTGHFPPEREMDTAATTTWLRVLEQHPLRLFELIPPKLGWFWLSTDILFYGKGLKPAVQLGRAAMVFVWWGYLVLAAMALRRLRREGQRGVFWLLVGWFGVITLAHLPFGMNTRLRIPLADLPVAVLAAHRLDETKLARRILGPETGSP